MAEGLPYKQKTCVNCTGMLEKACGVSRIDSVISVTVNYSVRGRLPCPADSPRVMKRCLHARIALTTQNLFKSRTGEVLDIWV